ncbi:zinc ribbon domain-containing protein [Iamia majanohamensis]|uniref:Zinc ribbon domain-containing protein n=1 Tax=Iamia majanohamensis TaxID=467976 RepID=A0AAF0BSW8_9ACTN|nr:FmdB family zinc ribbon protein [Iamia majanohamensis]WCO65947.1 zinc ribbon domain-containing protein [Iamia majanohamensis]
MPTYEYRCKDCGHTFDAYQSFTDDALTECPECHGALKKLFGNVGISFKGSGFYKTDSRSGATSSTSSSDKGTKETSSGDSAKKEPSASPSSSGDATKAETKKKDTSTSSTSSSS